MEEGDSGSGGEWAELSLEDDDYDYQYEGEESEIPSEGPSDAGIGMHGFLDGSEACLCAWAKGNPVRLHIVSCLRQIVTHPSGALSVVFSEETLLAKADGEDGATKEFLILVCVVERVVVSYTLTFNVEIELLKSPPRLVCLSGCGRGSYLFPDLLLPDYFGPFLDFGKVFFRLKEELGAVLTGWSAPIGTVPSDSMCSDIQHLAYITQYKTKFAVNVSDDNNGVVIGKIREKRVAPSDKGIGYSSSGSVSTDRDQSFIQRQTELLNRICARLEASFIESPLEELIYMTLKELSPEEALHLPEYSKSLFTLVGSMQYLLRASGIDLREDFLALLAIYKNLLGSDFGLDKIIVPDHLHASTRCDGVACSPNPVIPSADLQDSDLIRIDTEEILKGSVTVLDDGFKLFTKFKSNDSPPMNLVKRCRIELNTLRNNLSPNIHVLANALDLTCFKFLIIGPKDTPYEGGFFIFDMILPSTYPAEPPKVSFKYVTTFIDK